MLVRDELLSKERNSSHSKGRIKKELLPINLHVIDNKKIYDSLNINLIKKGKIKLMKKINKKWL